MTDAPEKRTLASPGILGCGHSLPSATCHNDDPVFRRMAQGPVDENAFDTLAFFTGADQRRRLSNGERIEAYMADAARLALAQAGIGPEAVDRLYGYASVPDHLTPNPLYELHHMLGLPRRTLVVPINSEFSNFLASLVLATESVAAGGARHVLIVCGSNWTQHVDYTKGHAFAVGDAAAAAVVGPEGLLRVVDHASETYSEQYLSMTMTVRPVNVDGHAHLPLSARGLPTPVYSMETAGNEVYQTLLQNGLPEVVNRLLARNGVSGSQVSLITHQGSRRLLDHWANKIAPGAYLESLQELGNMTLATYPVNLARHFATITTPYVVLAAVGTGCHLTAVLLENRVSRDA
ncbi:3-oxoacyl-[acyl-carrier-protein] synthase III C-terminal domain-containing protein [Streptomyces sp. L2]|uniref:3-oxoacyl-[acyl-carrier-protein] synthase III C-terminal domain-containing protein n=1 Tax=Streptomyces sp. L2 TaxID=2162665 RepID=UPI0010116DD0|nr:3-oxoacyl-[acyl-carrier-protein] synthase III C-terminal domain-containing protein [Streptomyces sp. L2]